MVILLYLLKQLSTSSALIALQTTAAVRGQSAADVLDLITTPSNWPTIVLSSWSVEGFKGRLQKGDSVKEVFGLPPVLPLVVEWNCAHASSASLDMRSPRGIPGLARDCRMLFEIT